MDEPSTPGVKAIADVEPASAGAREEFLTRPLGRLLGRHASPAVASMAFLALYQIVDGIMVGRSLGPEAMAAVNVLYPAIKTMDRAGQIEPHGYSRTLGLMIGGFVAVFAVAVIVYLWNYTGW